MPYSQKNTRPAANRDVGVYRAKARERMRREDEFEQRKAIRDLKRLSKGIYSLEGQLHQLMLVARECFKGTGAPKYGSLAEEIRLTGISLQEMRMEVNGAVMKAEGEIVTNFPPSTGDMRSLHTNISRQYRNAENRLFAWRDGL